MKQLLSIPLFTRRLSDFTDRREKSAGREQIFDRLKANSRSYLSKRVGNMVRSDDFAADSCKVRQPPSFFSRRRLHHHGFTLIEILVSISIVAITLTTVYGVFSSVSAAKNRLELDSETYHKARVIFDRFSRELHGAYLSSGNQDTILKGQKDSLENFSFEMSTTAASPLSSTGTGFALVTYTITDDSEADDDSKVLLRTEKPLLSEDASSTVRTMRLAPGINYFNMRFYDGDSWLDSWNSSSKGLPDIVEIEIRINAGQGDPVPFLSAIRLPEMSR